MRHSIQTQALCQSIYKPLLNLKNYMKSIVPIVSSGTPYSSSLLQRIRTQLQIDPSQHNAAFWMEIYCTLKAAPEGKEKRSALREVSNRFPAYMDFLDMLAKWRMQYASLRIPYDALQTLHWTSQVIQAPMQKTTLFCLKDASSTIEHNESFQTDEGYLATSDTHILYQASGSKQLLTLHSQTPESILQSPYVYVSWLHLPTGHLELLSYIKQAHEDQEQEAFTYEQRVTLSTQVQPGSYHVYITEHLTSEQQTERPRLTSVALIPSNLSHPEPSGCPGLWSTSLHRSII